MTALKLQIIQGSSIAQQPVIVDEMAEFLSDMEATFRREKHGVAGLWQYSSSNHADDPVRGALLWEDFLKTSKDYYLLSNEVRLIRDRAGDLIQDKDSPVILVDIGPGPEQAVFSKTLPVKHHFKDVKMYCPIDKCAEYLVSAGNLLHDDQLGLPVKAFHVDYFKDEIVIPKAARAFGIFFGGTIGNFEGHPDEGLPEERIISQLRHIREILGPDGTFMMTNDANQDADSILKSYIHPLQIAFGSNIMHRIARDLPVFGHFYPDAWHYEPIWHPKSHVVAHTIICDREQTFWLGEERFNIKEGESFILNNSYKYPVEKIKEWSSIAGFKNQQHIMDHENRQALHVMDC